jgi:YhcH/YjgK/YiaL family protein
LILDIAANCQRYRSLHPLFERGFRFLADTDLRGLAHGRHDVDGDRMYLLIDHTRGRLRDGARLESHRRYIDVQYTIEGEEEIGWVPLVSCGPPSEGYDAGKDVAFYDVRPVTWLAVPAGMFAIFFPEDGHAPLAGRGAVKKAILKITVDPDR